MEIKQASKEDLEVLSEELWVPLARNMVEYSELNELTEDIVESAKEGFDEILDDEDKTVFILEEDTEEIGLLVIEKGEKGGRKYNKYLAIIDLFVKEGYRSQGYGTPTYRESSRNSRGRRSRLPDGISRMGKQ